MAFDPIFRMSLQDNATGAYLGAAENNDASWTVYTSTDLLYLDHLPQDWDKTSVTWARNTTYMGIFRSMSSSGSYQFAKDGRAILNYMRSIRGIQADVTLTIYICNAVGGAITYDVFYASQLDFKTYSDRPTNQLLSIGTMDSALFRDLQAYGGTQYNVPIWKPDGLGGWLFSDRICVLHDGIKLLYNSTYTGSMSDDYIEGFRLEGFKYGNSGGLGAHTIPFMSQYNITQNNGATTFIGNTILQPFLIQGNQGAGASSVSAGSGFAPCNEQIFSGVNNSQPYTKSNYSIKNLLKIPDGSGGSLPIEVSVSVQVKFSPFGGPFGPPTPIDYADNGHGCFIRFVLFEIDSTDNPVEVATNFQYQTLLNIDLPAGGGGSFTPASIYETYSTPVNVSLQYDRVYVLGVIYDEPAGFTGLDSTNFCQFYLSQIQMSIASLFDNGFGGAPVPAPYFPASVAPALRLHSLASELVSYLPTRTTDQYGFPIVTGIPYSFSSSYLSDPSAALQGDARPYQVAWSSAYCLHNLEGQSYVTASFNQLFNFCKKVFGCGAYILGNTMHIERLSTIFDSSTMILDLGYDIDPTSMTIEQVTEGLGANLKLGYTAADLNSNFGTDSFNSEQFYDSPLSFMPGTMDYEVTDVVIDQYPIELMRSQRTSQPIGSSITPGNPSSDNASVILYCQPAAAPFVLPNIPVYPSSCQLYDPSNNPVGIQPWQLTMRDGTIYPGVGAAQATDASAATNPYISGLYYPDRAINVELSPCRALHRDLGALLHSVLDEMDSESLAFRNTFVMQYNNVTRGVTGIQSNLEVGAGVTPVVEFSDKSIAALPAQLFKPIKIKVRSRYPVNLYQTLNDNPNGYVRFFVKGTGYNVQEYKFFLTRAVQSAATGAATEFEGWATPDMVI